MFVRRILGDPKNNLKEIFNVNTQERELKSKLGYSTLVTGEKSLLKA